MIMTHHVIVSGIDSEGIPHLLPFNVHCGEPDVGAPHAPHASGKYELVAEAAESMGLESVVMFTREDPVPDGFFEMFNWRDATNLTSPSNMN